MKRYGELQIGITVLLALIVLVFGVVWFKGYSASHDHFLLRAYFPQASGLSKGDPVEVAGVVQGTVDKVDYDKGRALLVLSINRKAEIYGNAQVSISNFGIMGQKLVAIQPGTPDAGPINLAVPLEGRYETGPGDMMVVAGQSIKTMNDLAQRINRFLTVIDSTGGAESVGHTIKNLEKISSDMAELTNTSRGDLKKAIANFESASNELNEALKGKGTTMKGTIESLSRSSARFDSLTTQLSNLSDQLKRLADKAESREGSVGALLQDRQLYDRLLSTVARTDSLLDDVKKNPRRYFKFSVF